MVIQNVILNKTIFKLYGRHFALCCVFRDDTLFAIHTRIAISPAKPRIIAMKISHNFSSWYCGKSVLSNAIRKRIAHKTMAPTEESIGWW